MIEEWSYFSYDTPMGPMIIHEDGLGIARIQWESCAMAPKGEKRETELIVQAKDQLMEYFNGQRREFDLPLRLRGTSFQKKVWQVLRDIPYGEVRCYQEIADAIGDANASRAVGMANNRNPINIVVPCHRVLGSKGRLTGYSGGIELKKKLLELEKSM